jgi:ribonuclease VapC
MIVDSSALVAILKEEAGWERYAETLNAAEAPRISAAAYVELSIVIDRWKDPVLNSRVDELLARFNIQIEPFTTEQARIARQAYRDYGRGSGHAANLNYGDCFSYALARVMREPILFQGADFVHTDLRPAVGLS